MVELNTGKKICVLTLQKENIEGILSANNGAQIEVKVFEYIQDLLAAATECRLSILKTVIKDKPASLYELAKVLGKNQAYIYREAKQLRRLDLLEFETITEEGRKRVRPVALYDEVLIHL